MQDETFYCGRVMRTIADVDKRDTAIVRDTTRPILTHAITTATTATTTGTITSYIYEWTQWGWHAWVCHVRVNQLNAHTHSLILRVYLSWFVMHDNTDKLLRNQLNTLSLLDSFITWRRWRRNKLLELLFFIH